jgi:flagellar hook-basal body protein
MGNVAGFRKAWIDAADYQRKWDDFRAKREKGEKADAPKRDLQLDTLSAVLRGEILVQNHCYRGDEMAVMVDISKEFGYKISMFHHASEAYKVAPLLAKENICFATWADWQGFKMESYDGIEANAAIGFKAGACTVIHSDDAIITQRLNQEAAVAMAAGNRVGMGISEADAIKWITLNPANQPAGSAGVSWQIANDGKVMLTLRSTTPGTPAPAPIQIGQIQVQNFSDPGALTKVGSNRFSNLDGAGPSGLGTPGTGGRGDIKWQALEQANVDLASQFTDLIVTQRGYQANAKIITTSDEILQELINLKR